jgi:hypothetical protein
MTTLVRPDDDGVCALLTCRRRRYGESFLEFRCRHHPWCFCCCKSLFTSAGTLFSFFFLFFLGCVHPISIYISTPDIMLVHNLDIIDIFMILIYFLYKKNQPCIPRYHLPYFWQPRITHVRSISRRGEVRCHGIVSPVSCGAIPCRAYACADVHFSRVFLILLERPTEQEESRRRFTPCA